MKNQDPYGFLADLTAAPSKDPGWPEPYHWRNQDLYSLLSDLTAPSSKDPGWSEPYQRGTRILRAFS